MDRQPVLVIEREDAVRSHLLEALSDQGYEVHPAATGKEGIYLATHRRPTAILLDSTLVDIDSVTLCHMVRLHSKAFIVALAANNDEDHKVALLDAGADDYLMKPCSGREIAARFRAMERRHSALQTAHLPGIVWIGTLSIDLDRHLVQRDSATIFLTPTEWALLHLLVQAAGRIVSHEQISAELWQAEDDLYQRRLLHVFISTLRAKIDPPAHLSLIESLYRRGYRLRLT